MKKNRIIKEQIIDQGYNFDNFQKFLSEKKEEKDLNCDDLEEIIPFFCKKEKKQIS